MVDVDNGGIRMARRVVEHRDGEQEANSTMAEA
jgi:hypothetical protein